MLNFTKSVVEKIKQLKAGSIVVYHDNRRVVRRCNAKINKATKAAVNGGVVITEIKKLLK